MEEIVAACTRAWGHGWMRAIAECIGVATPTIYKRHRAPREAAPDYWALLELLLKTAPEDWTPRFRPLAVAAGFIPAT